MGNDDMNRKIIIVVMMVMVVLGLEAYTVYDDIFPKAEPIEQLEIGMLEPVKLYDNENIEIVISDEELQKLITFIKGAVATRIMSVNDYPSVRPYYVVEIKKAERIFRYIIYEEKGTTYVELPYEGVYEIDREVLEIFE